MLEERKLRMWGWPKGCLRFRLQKRRGRGGGRGKQGVGVREPWAREKKRRRVAGAPGKGCRRDRQSPEEQ